MTTPPWTRWIGQELKTADFGDSRLTDRCRKLGQAIAGHLDGSIPEACGDWGSIKGAYRFFAHEHVSRQAVLAAHYEETVKRVRDQSEVLAIQDTTYLNFSAHRSTEGLGPIGTSEKLQGLVVHNTLAVSASGEALGILDQAVWSRGDRRPQKETGWERQHRERESQCWTHALRRVRRQKVGSVIHVADREADIYELLEDLLAHGERFVIRSCWNRRVSEASAHMEEVLKKSPDQGRMVIEVSARPGQANRQATLTIRRAMVTLRPPKTVSMSRPCLSVQVVEAWERHAPKGCPALRWRLLTSEPVETLENCIRVIRFYTQRWKIEEFHKGLKTGCRVEERQLETRKRLEVFLGLASVISVLLLRMRDAARTLDRPATEFLSAFQITLLRRKYPRVVRKNPMARDVLRAVARWGGFIGRKSDGDPGWITLWRGMRKLLEVDHMLHLIPSIPRRSLPTYG